MKKLNEMMNKCPYITKTIGICVYVGLSYLFMSWWIPIPFNPEANQYVAFLAIAFMSTILMTGLLIIAGALLYYVVTIYEELRVLINEIKG